MSSLQPPSPQPPTLGYLPVEQYPDCRPWLWVPTLFFLQALPNTLITSVFPIAFRNLGVDVLTITAWTPLVSLPWTFKLFFAPFVDLTLTKRTWVLLTQALIFGLSAAAAAGLLLPSPFYPVLLVLLILAILSATHDIAADGLYLLTLSKSQQAAFVGVLTTSSRLGRLMANGAIVYVAGVLASGYGFSTPIAWAVTFAAAAAVYAGLAVYHMVFLPRSRADAPHTPPPATSLDVEIESPSPGAGDAPAGEAPTLHASAPVPSANSSAGTRQTGNLELYQHLYRTLALVMTGACIWALLSGLIRVVGHVLSVQRGIPQWQQSETGLKVWSVVGVAGLGLLLPSVIFCRRLLRNTEIGSALGTYFSQPRFAAVLFFILTYRLSEVMIGAISPYFLMDPRDKGGLAIPMQTLGTINGLAGTIGIILGGLAGGVFISRHGLRRAFLPLVLAMALPNLLYVLAAKYPDFSFSPTGGGGAANAHLYALIFIDQFGYGFGFAGYFVYLMYIAQRTPQYTTTHYAIGTGLGALTVILATALSGILQSALGYTSFFIAATALSLPGILSLLVIPMDATHGRGIKAEVD